MKSNWILMNRWKELRVFLLTWWNSFMHSSLNGWFTANLSVPSPQSKPGRTRAVCAKRCSKTLQRRIRIWKQKNGFIGLANHFSTCIIYHNSVLADIVKDWEEQISHSSCHLLEWTPSPSLSLSITFWISSLSPSSSVLESGSPVIKLAGWIAQVLWPIHIFPKLTALQLTDSVC